MLAASASLPSRSVSRVSLASRRSAPSPACAIPSISAVWRRRTQCGPRRPGGRQRRRLERLDVRPHLTGPVRSLQEVRQEGVIIQKWDTSCGAAALATVLTYSLKDPVSEREVAGHVEDDGAAQGQIPRRLLAARHEALRRAARLQGEGYRDLTLELAAIERPHRPHRAAWLPAFRRGARVRQRGRMKLADPGFGNRTMSVGLSPPPGRAASASWWSMKRLLISPFDRCGLWPSRRHCHRADGGTVEEGARGQERRDRSTEPASARAGRCRRSQ